MSSVTCRWPRQGAPAEPERGAEVRFTHEGERGGQESAVAVVGRHHLVPPAP